MPRRHSTSPPMVTYSILVNTTRYTTFLYGSNQKKTRQTSRMRKPANRFPPLRKNCIRTETMGAKFLSIFPVQKVRGIHYHRTGIVGCGEEIQPVFPWGMSPSDVGIRIQIPCERRRHTKLCHTFCRLFPQQ